MACYTRTARKPQFFLSGRTERNEDNSNFSMDGLEEEGLQDIYCYSVTYRMAVGPRFEAIHSGFLEINRYRG